MSMLAAGAYLRALRTARGLSRVAVATTLGTYPKQVFRWETAHAEPTAVNLARFTALVGGSPAHVHNLLLDEDATAADGERLAAMLLELEERGL